MGFGDAIRRLIDPIDPAVLTWLRRELPRLVQSGLIDAAQAEAIARRYSVGPLAAPEDVSPVSAVYESAQVETAPSQAPATSAMTPTLESTVASGAPTLADRAIAAAAELAGRF